MKIALLGDVALIGLYDKTITSDVKKRIEIVGQLVRECDYVIANLEAPLTSKKYTWTCKGVYLKSVPENVESLKSMGITHVSLANNHVYDYGKKAVDETINTLLKAGIKHVGLNNTPELLEIDKDRVLLDGFCCLSANALNYGDKLGQVKMLTPANMKVFLDMANRKNALAIASVHFGLEGLHYPSIEHLNLFRGFAQNYDYILHGNHPHAVQGYETVNHSLLIYAQGNLCFDETPVNSVHLNAKRSDEERKCYISILDIAQTHIVSHKVIPITDNDTGYLHISDEVGKEIKQYTNVLREPIPDIKKMRTQELHHQARNAQKRDIRFYLNRMNRRYIGAYLNGRRHAKEYQRVFKEYMGVQD